LSPYWGETCCWEEICPTPGARGGEVGAGCRPNEKARKPDPRFGQEGWGINWRPVTSGRAFWPGPVEGRGVPDHPPPPRGEVPDHPDPSLLPRVSGGQFFPPLEKVKNIEHQEGPQLSVFLNLFSFPTVPPPLRDFINAQYFFFPQKNFKGVYFGGIFNFQQINVILFALIFGSFAHFVISRGSKES